MGPARSRSTPAPPRQPPHISKDGKAVAKESVGGSYDAANARFSPFKFKTGKAAARPRRGRDRRRHRPKKHYEVGDDVVVSTLGKKHTYRISGTVSYGSVDSLGFASIAAWDVKTAQTLLDREGRYDSISVAAKKGTSPAAARAGDQAAPAGATCEVKDAAPAGQGRRREHQRRA